jgi:hypothetical protein
MGTGNKLKDEVIKLPFDKNGDPDWQYMETYMKGIEKNKSPDTDRLHKKSKV